MDQWNDEYPNDARNLADRITTTPRREDVDKFIIRMAADAAKRGCLVKIVSNDNFREYIGEVKDFHFSEDWVRDHAMSLVDRLSVTNAMLIGLRYINQVVKFCFSAGSEDFIPADGVGEGHASDVGNSSVPEPEASTNATTRLRVQSC